jgi:membrane-bound lytic murein transglycosylase A
MRNILITSLVIFLSFSLSGCWRGQKKAPPTKPAVAKDYNRQLAPGEQALVEVPITDVPDLSLTSNDRVALQQAIRHSLAFLSKPSADMKFPIGSRNGEITRDQVTRSLQALAELLQSTTDNAQLNAGIKSRFRALMSVGFDGQGGVLFTGYYTPIFNASTTRDNVFKYPIYKRPSDLVNATNQDAIAMRRNSDGSMTPYPSRAELETSGALNGLEFLYFADPYEAYIVEVQGSAKVILPTGSMMEVGFSGTNNHKYHPIAMDLVNEGKIRKEDLNLPNVRKYFKENPNELDSYRKRNPRFIFFTQVKGGPFGSLGQPVTTDVTVATDKTIFPAGAACIVDTTAAFTNGTKGNYAGLRLDQDSGGGIRAAGRCDLFMGEGETAEARAGHQFAEGKLYYLLLKE